jgi:RimJ/RimL family protein N-acetyltransferase
MEAATCFRFDPIPRRLLAHARETTIGCTCVPARIDWTTDAGQLAAVEADLDLVEVHADALSAGYNDPANAPLMGHTAAIEPFEVVESYAELIEDGGRAFILFLDGAFAGDADLRNIHDGAAEFAFMIGAPAAQGKGLGTRFATMVHVFAFRELGLHHVYASIVPHNTASRRVFEKLGYTLDDSPTAREFADEPGDIVMAIDRDTFGRVHAAELGRICVTDT